MAPFYANLAGQHQIKVGVQADRLGNDVLSGESRNLVTIRWNTALSTGVPLTRGTYGYYEVRSNAVAPNQGLITVGDIHTNNNGLFAQDAWTIGSRLTVNAGIRTEHEKVPTYLIGDDVPEFGLDFGFGDKLAPRVGVAYDLRGDGQTKAFGSWGVFYDIFKLELPRGSFGGEKWLSYYYTLDTFDWPNLVTSPNCPPACPGTIIRGAPTAANPIGGIDFRSVVPRADSLDPNLKPMRQQEATAGLEHQLNDRSRRASATSTSSSTARSRTRASCCRDGSEGYVIANPGEGLTALAYTNPSVALPKPKRDYNSVEFAVEKRLRRQLVPAQQLPVEPPLWQLHRTVAVGRERPHRAERRPRLRLSDDDVPGRRQRRPTGPCRPIGRTSSRRSSSTRSRSAPASG